MYHFSQRHWHYLVGYFLSLYRDDRNLRPYPSSPNRYRWKDSIALQDAQTLAFRILRYVAWERR